MLHGDVRGSGSQRGSPCEKNFNNRELFLGGELQVIDGDVWVKVFSRDRV
jgi:hypothetical protein